MLRALCLTTALTVGSLSVEAADSQGRYAAHGLGRLQCRAFVEMCEKQAEECRLTGTWITGYLTGFNALNDQTFDILPWQAPELVAELAFNWCRQNPERGMVDGVNQVLQALYPRRIEAAAERTRVGEGTNAIYLYRQTIRELQERLIQTGHLKGAADGVFGPGTQGAVEAFQKATGLAATGIPDQRTLIALFFRAGEPQQEGEQGQRQAPRPAAPASGSPAQQPAPQLDLNLVPPSN